MKKKYLLSIIGTIIVLIILLTIIILKTGIEKNSGEDNWIQDSNGVWIKHGNPSTIPDNIVDSNTLQCVLGLYQTAFTMKMKFNSQCLGTCGNYSIDIVNVPRNSDDDLLENQCSDFKNGITDHFIELDKNGNLVRVF